MLLGHGHGHRLPAPSSARLPFLAPPVLPGCVLATVAIRVAGLVNLPEAEVGRGAGSCHGDTGRAN